MSFIFSGLQTLNQSQQKSIKNEASKTGEQKALGREQTAESLKSMGLKPGQIFSGEVVFAEGREVQIALSGDQLISAKLDQQMSLALGSTMSFEVNANGGQISLRPLYANLSNYPAMLSALEAAGIPYNEKSGEMVAAMMEEGLPVDKQSLQTMYRQVQANPEAASRTIVLMSSLELPLAADTIAQFEQYQAGRHQLVDTVEGMIKEFPKLVLDAILKDGISEGIAVNQELLDIFLEEPNGRVLPKESEALPSLKADANPEHAPVKNGQNQETLIPKEGINPGDAPLEEIEKGAKELDARVSGLPKEELPLTPKERATLAEQLKAVGVLPELAEQVKGGDIKASEILRLVRNALKQPQVLPKAVRELLTGKEYQAVLKEEISRQWLVEPKDVAQKENVEELYKKLDEQTSKAAKMLESLGKGDSSLMKGTENLKQNVNFMNQVNQLYTYIQLPLKMSSQNAHGDLYVYTNKKKLLQKEGDITALLHLDMDHLGAMDIHITLKDLSHVKTNFRLEKEETIGLIEKNLSLLNKSLEQKGYTMDTEVTGQEKKVGFVEDFLKKDKRQKKVQHLSFDVRA